MLVHSEPSCDQTEFLHSNGTCVACPVCVSGEQLSEVDLFVAFVSLLCSLLHTTVLYVVVRTVVLETVGTGSVFPAKTGRSAQKQVLLHAEDAPGAVC